MFSGLLVEAGATTANDYCIFPSRMQEVADRDFDMANAESLFEFLSEEEASVWTLRVCSRAIAA